MSVKTLAARLQYQGGDSLGRINKQKLKSLEAALKNDYNSRMIKTNIHTAIPCLINTNNLKPDYDKKILSVPFSSQLEAGDVFEVLDDNTHWMVYLPILTETAYLRAEIVRCRYQIEIDDEVYWVYFQGPTETDLRWFIKQGVNYNELNLSGTIYIKNNEKTKSYFARFTHIKIGGHTWEVQVTDPISVPGVLELEVQEYYDNTIAELPEIKINSDISTDPMPIIKGETTVKQNSVIGYSIADEYYDPNKEWSIQNNPRVKIEETMQDGRVCKVRVYPGAVRSFDVVYGKDQSLTVNIDWAKPIIQGPQIVYPYDTHTYFVKDENRSVTFALDTNLAKIVETGNDYCRIDIITGKKGEFTLYCLDEDNNKTELDIQIKSL